MNISHKQITRVAAVAVLSVMFAIFLSTGLQESAIMDELAHIPAGYSYLKYQDMRINPEHPPLLKDISALPLLFLDLKFPENSKSWAADINGQWDLGREFLYKSGNNPDEILFWARLGPIVLTLLFGFLLFRLGSEFFGAKTALLSLILFAFSPAILAHGKYVTTDTAAAFGFFTGIFYFLRYLKSPSNKNLLIAGVFFGIAQSLKFSLVLLVPFLLGIVFLWVLANEERRGFVNYLKSLAVVFLKTFVIFAVGFILIVWPLYQFHTWNYPAAPSEALREGVAAPSEALREGVAAPATLSQRAEISAIKSCDDLDKQAIGPSQFRDTACTLKLFRFRPLADLITWMSDKPILRPYAQYALGVLMVGTRTVGGNTTYFLGEVSRDSWWYYFPTVYFLKEPLAIHILSLSAILIILLACLKLNFRPAGGRINAMLGWLKKYFTQVTLFLFIAFYFAVSMTGNLNIGVRHIIPTFPFIFLLISDIITRFLKRKPEFVFTVSLETFKNLAGFYAKKSFGYILVFGLVGWYVISVLIQYPYFIAYFNEAAGGPENGYKYVADSNLDWGQDLKRLTLFAEENNIDKIRLNYFGGGSQEYYLGDKFISWWSARGPEPGWHAISATFLDEAFGQPVGRYERKPQDSYFWLKGRTPTTVIGHSIFVYEIK